MSLILGIETSCDETAAAVVQSDFRIRSNVIASQADLHRRYGGVVPELAARRHIERLLPVVETALTDAGVTFDDLAAVAVTRGPGLVGSLAVGVAAAAALAYARRVPLVGVNHLEGHLYANRLDRSGWSLPAVALIVSGAHTDLIYIAAEGRYEVLGRTRDDAAGEAFDKIARAMGLGYPGGAALDRLAEEGDPAAVRLPLPMPGAGFEFSFSGLKTAALRAWRASDGDRVADSAHAADLAAALRRAIVETLVRKLFLAVDDRRPRSVMLAGGVAANRLLRARVADEAQARGLELLVPPPVLCTDNAAMIAAVGWAALQQGRPASPLSAAADLPLA